MYLSLLSRLSLVSVVLDCNASLNDLAPLSPILFPVVFHQIHDIDARHSKKTQMNALCLTFQIQILTGNDVHHKSNTLNRAFFHDRPYRNNQNVSFLFFCFLKNPFSNSSNQLFLSLSNC